jgi:hypothetical protein
MAKKPVHLPIPDEVVIKKILLIRNKKVILDKDLAKLYGVETYNLNKAPDHPSQNATNWESIPRNNPPYTSRCV